VLINASPDVRTQLAAFEPVGPAEGSLRGSGISAVVLTNADIDHCAGLLVLREGGAPPIYSTDRVRTALTEGLTILPVLAAYGTVDVREIVPGQKFQVHDRNGEPLGIWFTSFAVASKPPPYMSSGLKERTRDDLAGDTIGLIIEAGERGTVAYVPGVRELDEPLAASLALADLILIDGTFYTDDELVALGASAKTARTMGHAPIQGPDGTLAFLGRFPRARRVLVHINNTNPILVEGSAERRAVEQAGVEVGEDGMTFRVGSPSLPA